MPRVLGGSQGGSRFLMGEVPLYRGALPARREWIFIELMAPDRKLKASRQGSNEGFTGPKRLPPNHGICRVRDRPTVQEYFFFFINLNPLEK